MKLRRLGFYPRYSELGASSRHRFFDYAGLWSRHGGDTVVEPFFSDRYLKRLYAGKGKSALSFLSACGRRLFRLSAMPDTVIIEYELFPFLPARLELFLLRKRCFFLNYDDLVQLKYRKMPLLKNKYEMLMSRAAGVICANDKLTELARLRNNNVIKLPTPVDLSGYDRKFEKFPVFTAVWIGTPVTYRYLQNAAEQLRAMAQAVDFELLVIASAKLPPIDGVRCRMVDWSQETEAEYLLRSHVGLMPLPHGDEFAAGKSAYKLIQYCAAALPAIASNVGENRMVLRDGVNGFLAETPQEWAAAFARLHEENELYAAQAKAAAEFSAEYGLERSFERFRFFIDDSAENR